MNALCRIELLGGLRIRYGERSITRFRTRKAGALLAYLAYFHTQSHSREVLVEMLWPELPADAGRNNLSTALSSLRHQLALPGVPAGALLICDRLSVSLHPSAIHTDVEDYKTYLANAETATGETERAQHLADAIAVYSGPLLPDYYEEWVGVERRRLADAYLQAIRSLIRSLIKSGEISRAFEYANKAIQTDPLSEEAHRDLMRLYIAQGRHTEAVRQYHELEQLLDRELGTSPSVLTRRVVEQVRREAPPAMPQEMLSLTAVPLLSATRPAESGPNVTISEQMSPAPYARGTVTLLLAAMEMPATTRQVSANSDTATLRAYRGTCRMIVRRHGGDIFQAVGSTIRAAFAGAAPALACSIALQRALAQQAWPQGLDPLPARIALHTGDVAVETKDYAGPVLQQALRLLAAGHSGQILCSEATLALLKPGLEPGVRLTDLGTYRLHAESEPQRLFQVEYPEMSRLRFPPLKAEPGYAALLPPQLTRFFGRENEIIQLMALLRGQERESGRAGDKENQASVSEPPLSPAVHQDSGVQSAIAGDSSAFGTTSPPLLFSRSSRLVTLTGPGGVGKTRLAIEVANRLFAAFSGAVWFAPLAALTDARLIVDVLLQAMRLPRMSVVDPIEQFVETLSRQPALIILDNFEHLIETGTPILKTLIERLPSLTCLITSRQSLGIAGEQEFPVPPLPIPADGQEKETYSPFLLSFPSVQLFVDRAQAVKPDFQITERNARPVAELCARLEGIPLAIELAAARAPVLPPAQMLAQLDNRFDFLVSHRRDLEERHRTLRATIDWSYRLLEPQMQRCFAHMAIFRGGWTLEAAEYVCGADEGAEDRVSGVGKSIDDTRHPSEANTPHPIITPPDARHPDMLDFLVRLQEYSLIVAEEDGSEMRFRMLETLREFAEQQLTAEEHALLARRHADYFLALAQAAEPNLITGAQVGWLQRLEAEYDNLRAALAWCHSRADAAQTELRLAGALWRFWLLHSHIDEGWEWLSGVLARPEIERRSLEGGKALFGAGFFAENKGEEAVAYALLEESLAVRREIADEHGVAESLIRLGRLYYWRGDSAQAWAMLEQGLAIRRRFEDSWGIAATLNYMGNMKPDEESKTLLYEESLTLFRRSGDRYSMATVLHNLAAQLEMQGEYARARLLREEQLALCEEIGDRGGIGTALAIIGELAFYQGDLNTSRASIERSLSIRRKMADRHGTAHSLFLMGDIAYDAGDTEQARNLYRESFDLARNPYISWMLIPLMRRFARLAVSNGQMEQGVRLAAAAQQLQETVNLNVTPYELTFAAQISEIAHASLGEEAFATVWAQGRAMTIEQAIEYALTAESMPSL